MSTSVPAGPRRRSQPPSETFSSPPTSPRAPRRSLSNLDTLDDQQAPAEADRMDSSYLLVQSHVPDDDQLSIDSSLRDSVIEDELGDLLTDSESEPPAGREGWYNTDDEDSVSGDREVHEVSQEVDETMVVPQQTLEEELSAAESSPLIDGSYIDAEATASMIESRSTINDHLNNLSDSQVRLIMPDPAASYTTSSSSDNTTPSGSLGNLLRLPDLSSDRTVTQSTYLASKGSKEEGDSTILPLRRSHLTAGTPPFARNISSIEKNTEKEGDSWLDRSSKLWELPPELRPKVRSEESFKGEYRLLQSQDDIKATIKTYKLSQNTPPPASSLEKDESGSDSEWEQAEIVSNPARLRQAALRRVIATANRAGVRGLAKKWSVRASVLALASVLSLSLLASMNNRPLKTTVVIKLDTQDAIKSPMLPASGKTLSIWDHLAISPLAVTTNTGEGPAATPQSTPFIPDLQVIKQALSTFSTSPNKATPAEPLTTDSKMKEGVNVEAGEGTSHPRRKRKASGASDPCCALSVRNKNDALIGIPSRPSALIATDQSRPNLVRRMFRATPNLSEPAVQIENETDQPANCSCDVMQRPATELLVSWLAKTIKDYGGPVALYSATALQHINEIYEPVMAELQKEYRELVELFRSVAEASSTLSEFLIRRAARGVSVSRQAMERATSSLRQRMPEIPKPLIDQEAIARARQRIDNLHEYVEEQAASLAEYMEEQSIIVHEKSMESLKQAKKGLDKLIIEARRMVDGQDKAKTETNVHDEGPMPFLQMEAEGGGPKRWKDRIRSSRKRRRESRSAIGEARRRVHAHRRVPPEEPSRARKLLDAIHHGAMALVM